jgi:hypothetical protein
VAQIQLSYISENREVQKKLDKVYGTVIPIERHVNDRASLLFYCLACQQQFYGSTRLLLNKESQKHICYYPYGDQNGNRSMHVSNKGGSKPKTTKAQQQKLLAKRRQRTIELNEQGLTIQEIGKHLGISGATVSKYLKQAGLK